MYECSINIDSVKKFCHFYLLVLSGFK